MSAVSFADRTNENGGNGSSRQENRESGTGFSGILAAEIGKVKEPKDVLVRNSGYSKMGMPTKVFIKMHDYTYR